MRELQNGRRGDQIDNCKMKAVDELRIGNWWDICIFQFAFFNLQFAIA
jgi:hypothetical protein